MTACWRPMRSEDIGAVIAIAAVVHPGYPEDDHVLAEKLALYPDGCFVYGEGHAVTGYMLSHPYLKGAMPKLNTLFGSLPEAPGCYYFHDIALLPEAQGRGAAVSGLATLIEHARTAGFSEMALCAVNGSAAFWQRRGFAPAGDTGLEAELASYGDDVHYLTMAL